MTPVDNMFVSMVRSLSRTRQERLRGTESTDEDFSQMLKMEADRIEEKGNQTASTAIHDRKKEEEEEKQKSKQRMERSSLELSPLRNYLYNLVCKDEATLSLRDKSFLGLDEMVENCGVGIQEFQRLLSQRGIRLSDLTFGHIAQLAQRNSRAQLIAFLDELTRQKREGTLDQTLKSPLAVRAEEKAGSRPTEDVPPAAAQTREARPEEHAARREEVIQQIIQHIELKNLKDRTELSIRLNPEFLGDLKLRLSTEGGTLSADIQTTSREVREMIETSRQELSEFLTKSGLRLGAVRVETVDEIT